MRRNDKIMIVESLYRDQAAFFGLGAPSQVQLFMQRRFKKENYKKNKEERKNLPSQTIQPFQTREKSNPHCHSIYQAQCLHFSPCKQESNLFSKRCTRYKRPSLHLFQENNWASKIKKENENWKTGNGSYPLQETAILFHIRCCPRLSKSFNCHSTNPTKTQTCIKQKRCDLICTRKISF